MSKQKSPSLNALRVFATAAHADSFKQAAQQLGVSQSNITRQIQALEEQLGTRLFQRDNRVHSLTAAGQVLAPDLLRLFKELDRIVDRTRNIGDSELTTLRLAIPESFLRWWLSSRISDFYTLYPHVQLHFTTVPLFPNTNDKADLCSQLQHEQLDLAILYGNLRDKTLEQKKIYTPTYIPVSCTESHEPLGSRPWLVDLEAPYWKLLSKQESYLVKHIHPRPVGNPNIAIDLIANTDQITMVDALYLKNEQLKGHTTHTEYQVTLKEPMQFAMKQRPRQPVALIAFMKWLESHLVNSPAGSASQG